MKKIISFLMLFVLTASFVMAGSQSSFSEKPDGTRSISQPQPEIYINGDWNVTTDTVISNETIILSGNLTVSNNANLTFRNVTLKMNSTNSTEYSIEVLSGSTFKIFDLDGDNTTTSDASVIERNDTDYTYFFRAYDGSTVEMRNSELHGCGRWSGLLENEGLYIETDNATIDHNLISYNNDGIVLYGSDATISNNTITWNNDTGIFSGYWSNGTIENNWITWNYDYGIYITGGGSTGTKPSNPTVIGNVITDTGRGTNTAVGIQIVYGSKPLIKNTVILRSTEDGVYSDSSTPTLINVTIDGANYGISTSSTRYIYIYNTTIRNTDSYDFSVLGNPGTFFIATNSTFNESKITIDQYGNLTVRWYLHVYVEDNSGIPISGADVRVRDNENGTYDENFSTDDNGYVKWIVLKEYWANKTTKIYYTPYNISVNYSDLNFTNNPRDTNMNTSKTEVFRATSTVPEFDSVVIPVVIAVFIGWGALRRRKTKG